MRNNEPWPARIGTFLLERDKVAAVDSVGIFTYRLPRLASTEAEVTALEERLTWSLPTDYRGFLLAAGGWPCFFHNLDLYGPQDLVTGDEGNRGAELLGFLEEEALASLKLDRRDLIAIGAATESIDLLVMGTKSGEVLWFAGDLVERFKNFTEAFSSLFRLLTEDVETVREEARKLEKLGAPRIRYRVVPINVGDVRESP